MISRAGNARKARMGSKNLWMQVVRDDPMPKVPKGEKGTADVMGNAVQVMRIATSEIEEDLLKDEGEDPAAASMGKRGGKARAEKMAPERR
jgi:hypothetical protein